MRAMWDKCLPARCQRAADLCTTQNRARGSAQACAPLASAPASLFWSLMGVSVCPGAGITEELLTYLTIADLSMREELVLKTAVLAEKCVQPRSVHHPTCLCTCIGTQHVSVHLA